MAGEHVPCPPVAAIFGVLLVSPQSSGANHGHCVDGGVHHAGLAVPWRADSIHQSIHGPRRDLPRAAARHRETVGL